MPNNAAQPTRVTFANFTSVLALVVALGVGTSYAAAQLPKNSVGTKQIKNGAITGKDLKRTTLADLKAPRAYGVFRSDGTLVVGRSRNVTTSRNGTGDFCVNPIAASGIVPEKTTIIATPDYSDGVGASHIVSVFRATQPDQPLDCPNGFNLLTATETAGSFAAADIAVSFVIP